MEANAQQHLPYDVAVESVGMNWEHAGPLFDRYSVNLTGRLDRRWASCYNSLAATEEYARFRLDPGAANVSFTCRSTDGPVQVMKVLKKLEALVESVNRKASQDVLSERETRTTPPSAVGKPARISLAERFGFSRGSD